MTEEQKGQRQGRKEEGDVKGRDPGEGEEPHQEERRK